MKRFVLVLSLLALVVPAGSHAETTTYTAPYALGPEGGDNANTRTRNANTGAVTVMRHQPFGISGGLGCGGSGAFAYFQVTHDAVTPVSSATVDWTDGVFSSFSYVNVGVRKGPNYLNSEVARQPVNLASPGEGSLTVTFPATSGTLVAWFGLQLSSSCPSVEAAHAVFESISFS